MRIFNIFSLHDKDSFRVKVVEQGFSFKLLVFQSLWFLSNRMWFISALNFLIQYVLIVLFLKDKICANLFWASYISLIVLFSLIGQNLFESFLVKKGFDLDMVVLANDIDEAKLKYFNEINGKL